MPTLSVFRQVRFQDVLDIIFLSFVAYHLYIWFYETKAFKALVGLLGLGIIYSVAQSWGLFLTTWVFQILWQVLIILLIILFQPEIRQVLEKVNPFYSLGWRKSVGRVPWIESFCKTIFELGTQRTGALILFERKDRLQEFVTGGISFEADPTREVIVSIFQKHSPLHDGAVLMHNGRITMAACFLPLTLREGVAKEWGTRHRSAIGITERCDAWALVVGELEPIKGPEQLEAKLKELLTPSTPESTDRLQKVKQLILNRWRIKLATLAIVSVIWFSFAGQQNVEVTLDIPLTIQNLSPQLEVEPANQNVTITARGLLPNDHIEVIRIEPSNLTLELRRKLVQPNGNKG